MWKNIVEWGRPQMTILQMCIARCIPRATNTHSGCVIVQMFSFHLLYLTFQFAMVHPCIITSNYSLKKWISFIPTSLCVSYTCFLLLQLMCSSDNSSGTQFICTCLHPILSWTIKWADPKLTSCFVGVYRDSHAYCVPYHGIHTFSIVMCVLLAI
jgi:hypothetical protein